MALARADDPEGALEEERRKSREAKQERLRRKVTLRRNIKRL